MGHHSHQRPHGLRPVPSPAPRPLGYAPTQYQQQPFGQHRGEQTQYQQFQGGYQPPAPPQPPAGLGGPAPILPRPRKRWPWVVAAVAAFLFVVVPVLGSLGSSGSGSSSPTSPAAGGSPSPSITPTPAVPAAPAPEQPAQAAGTVDDGTYEVGPDLAPGKYKTRGSDDDAIMGCSYYVEGTAKFGYSKGPGVVTLKSGETVTFSGGCTWTKQ